MSDVRIDFENLTYWTVRSSPPLNGLEVSTRRVVFGEPRQETAVEFVPERSL